MGFVPYSSPESIELYPISDGELKHTGIKRIKWIFYESWGIKKNYIFGNLLLVRLVCFKTGGFGEELKRCFQSRYN